MPSTKPVRKANSAFLYTEVVEIKHTHTHTHINTQLIGGTIGNDIYEGNQNETWNV